VEEFKNDADLALDEPKTITWYAFKLGPQHLASLIHLKKKMEDRHI